GCKNSSGHNKDSFQEIRIITVLQTMTKVQQENASLQKILLLVASFYNKARSGAYESNACSSNTCENDHTSYFIVLCLNVLPKEVKYEVFHVKLTIVTIEGIAGLIMQLLPTDLQKPPPTYQATPPEWVVGVTNSSLYYSYISRVQRAL